jgi:hypothetical protein
MTANNYRLAVYTRPNSSEAWTGPQPVQHFAYPLSSSGSFTLRNWAEPGSGNAIAAEIAVLVLPTGLTLVTRPGSALSLKKFCQDACIWPRGLDIGLIRPPIGSSNPVAILNANREILLPILGTSSAIQGVFYRIPPASVRDPENVSPVKDNCLVLAYIGTHDECGSIRWTGPLEYPQTTNRNSHVDSTGSFSIQSWSSRVADDEAPFMAVLCARTSLREMPVFVDEPMDLLQYCIDNYVLYAPGTYVNPNNLFFMGPRSPF